MAASKAEAPFVFEGSVKSLKASNVEAVPADARTVVVQVDHVRHAPRAMAGFAGQEVTVRLAPGESLHAGEQAVFFADGLVFGDHIAVQSLGHDPLVAQEARAALAGATPVVHKLRNRIDAAQAVISGQVSAVRSPQQPAAVAARAGRSGVAPEGRISEHAPFWQDAVIAVSQVHKGPAQKQVVVRFPSSTDVRWRLAPKFKKGQKGTWLLHAGADVGARGAARAAAAKRVGAAAGVYTALDPNDFQPASESAAVKAMFPARAAAKVAKRKPVAAKRRKKPVKRKRGKQTRAKSRAKRRA